MKLTARPWRRASDAPARDLRWALPLLLLVPLVEMVRVGDRPELWPALIVFTTAAITAAAIDIDVMRIPTKLVYPAAAVTEALIAVAALTQHDIPTLTRSLLCGIVTMLWWYMCALLTAGFGLGDVRLGLLIGLMAGAYSTTAAITAVLAASLLGFVTALIHRLRNRTTTHFAFGPCMVAGALIGIWSGHGLN